jgi:hypothetical protein
MGNVLHDVIDKLMRVFQIMLVDKFNQLFLTLSYNKDLGLISLNLLTVRKLVKLAETMYQDLLVEGEWTGAGASGSSFIMQKRKATTFPAYQAHVYSSATNASKNIHKGKTCWNCDGRNHILSTCNQPCGQAPHFGHGQGRGDHGGCGHGRGPGYGQPPSQTTQLSIGALGPLGPSDAHSMFVGQESIFWCGLCGLWNSHHKKMEHITSHCPENLHSTLMNSTDEPHPTRPGLVGLLAHLSVAIHLPSHITTTQAGLLTSLRDPMCHLLRR